MGHRVETKIISSLNKCFVNERLENKKRIEELCLLGDEQRSFQLACQMGEEFTGKINFSFKIDSEIGDSIKCFRIMQMPGETPIMEDEHDEIVLRTEVGLYPDMCLPFGEGEVYSLTNHRLVSFLFDVNTKNVKSGIYKVRIELLEEPVTNVQMIEAYEKEKEAEERAAKTSDGKNGVLDGALDCRGAEKRVLCSEEIELRVSSESLPRQEIIHTEWLYCDTLKVYYGVETFSREHYELIRNYIRMAAENGINMLLTPVFTYALDTKVGGERPTTQLVGVIKEENKYKFNFDRFDVFVRIALEEGIEYFEIGHFFSQWGAKATPKVIAETTDGERQIFGWDTPGDDEGYREFLKQFIPALKVHLERLGIEDKTFYHVSDEPGEACILRYKKCYELISSMLPAERIIDAMSNFSFYESGAIERPVPSTGAICRFLEAGVKPLWTYYCCDARLKLPNRYFAMPSTRNRILGLLLYKFDIVGFLHWGFNFYFSQYSTRPINPFVQTDCDGFAESGDAYLVYPGPDGQPIPSLRLKVLRDAFEDIRRLRLLEEKLGREAVLRVLEENLGDFSFSDYPTDIESFDRLERKICERLDGNIFAD